jgi:hypothetical protein
MIESHTALPWHTHPFPNVVYVLSGTLTLHDKASGEIKVVHQAEAVGESSTTFTEVRLVTSPPCYSSPKPARRVSRHRSLRKARRQSTNLPQRPCSSIAFSNSFW